MDTVPQIISTKDLSYLSDMFNWNYNAFKEVNHFISEVQDEKIKNLLERVCNMHEDHMYFIISAMRKENLDDEGDLENE